MLWFAIHLPLLSLEAFCALLPPDQRQRPVALLEAQRLTAVNAEAVARGLQPGLKRATALALAPDLLLGQADAARDVQALQGVVHAALAFTPSVCLEGDTTVLLEVQASLRCFGGVSALRQRLSQALAPLSHRLQIAGAPTALGAALLARWRPGFDEGAHTQHLPALQALLDRVPVWLLGPGREHWEALQGMGVHTLSDLCQLPRAGLARRFGEDLLDDLDRARGLQPDPRPWLSVAATFDSRLELYARADSTEQVLHGAGVLLGRLLVWAQARQARVAAFTLLMHHEPRHRAAAPPDTELHVELAEPSADLEHLRLLLRERLAHCPLAAPTLELQMACRHLAHRAPPNQELFPTHQGQAEGLVRLLERLRARLGDEQVQGLEPVADHRPERASRRRPAHGVSAIRATASLRAAGRDAPARLRVPLSAPALPLHRPVWLLPEPLPLPERHSLPLHEGRPLQLLCGPQRLESGWWDAALATRDYFIAQAADGALVWIFRTRLAAPEARQVDDAEAGWFLHGRFG